MLLSVLQTAHNDAYPYQIPICGLQCCPCNLTQDAENIDHQKEPDEDFARDPKAVFRLQMRRESGKEDVELGDEGAG